MKQQLGIAVSLDSVRAVIGQDSTIRWATEIERSSTPLHALFRDLERRLPAYAKAAIRRTVIAIGPAGVWVKRLTSLPPVEDPEVVRALLCENSARYFVRGGLRPRLGAVQLEAPGVAWAAAFEESLVAEILDACRTCGLRVRAIVPSVVALAAAVGDGEGAWRDGAVQTRIQAQRRILTGISHRRWDESCNASAGSPFRFTEPSPLASLGDAGWRFADAYGAALSIGQTHLAIRPSTRGPIAHARQIAAAAAAALGLLSAAASPILSARLAASRASRESARSASATREAVRVEAQLAAITNALNAVVAFRTRRRSVLETLARLTRGLPDSVALVDLTIDGDSAMAVVLATSAAGAVAALERTPGIRAPAIVGSITRDAIGGRTLERAALRFSLDLPR